MTPKQLTTLVVLALCCPGCQSTPETPPEQDAALADPFNYKVDMPDSVSGGKIHEVDKQGLKGDLDRLLNP